MRVNISKFTENAANVAILIVASLLAVVLIRNFILPSNNPQPVPPVGPPDFRIAAGTRISLPNEGSSSNQPTLLLVVSDTCRYCTESAEFYKKLVDENARKKSFRIVAVLPQELERGKKYLASLGVSVDDIKTMQLNEIGVKATPTLMLIDRNGLVSESWVGKLPKDKENEVLSRL